MLIGGVYGRQIGGVKYGIAWYLGVTCAFGWMMRPKRCFFAMLAVVYFIGLEAVHGAKERDQEATVPLHGFVYLSLTTDGCSREERRW